MKKRKIKSEVKIIFLILILLILGVLIFITFFNQKDHKQKDTIEKTVYSSEKYYHEYAQITKDSPLYKKDGDSYKEIGTIYQGTLVSFDKPSKEQQYFQIKDTDTYVFYDSITKGEEKQKDTQYQRFLPFNENVEGENLTLFQEDQKKITLNEKQSFPIYRKTEQYYFVEYQGELYQIKKEEGSVVPAQNTDTESTDSVSVLNYHFFYDPEVETCDQIICHTKNQFIEQLEYLKQNQYVTLTSEELKMFLKGEIRLPKNSVAITIDDGYLAKLGVTLLTQYQMNATLFLITAWYDPKEFETDYVKVESHSHNMHNTGVCPGGQGGAIKCWSDEKILEDLKASQDRIGGSSVFCYPFYEYNSHSIELLKQAGFEMAFIGGNRKAKVGVDLMQIPRYVVYSNTTLEDFKKKL